MQEDPACNEPVVKDISYPLNSRLLWLLMFESEAHSTLSVRIIYIYIFMNMEAPLIAFSLDSSLPFNDDIDQMIITI